MPKVSVVIPCFNHGAYIGKTIASVLRQTYQDIEIIVVDDGSDDDCTRIVLEALEEDRVRVLHTENHGLATARNIGIKAASGEFILPLDADDLIASEYIAQSTAILQQNSDLGIVYCRAQLFGAVETEWLLPPYSLKEMLLDNVIFCSALFRKSDWEAVGGYDPGMIYGWEDYDFWLSLIERGRQVYQIPEILFSYRVASDSMVRSKERWQKVAMFKRIFERHKQLFTDNIDIWIIALLDVREKYYSSKLYVDMGNGFSDDQCVSRKVEKSSSEIQFSLQEYQEVKAIRFDPVDVPAVIEILEISILGKDGKRTLVANFSDNSIGMAGSKLYFDTNDSNCFLNLRREQLQNLKSITVKLSFIALAADALQQIVQFQQRQIEKLTGKQKHSPGSGLKAVGKALQKRVEKLKRRV